MFASTLAAPKPSFGENPILKPILFHGHDMCDEGWRAVGSHRIPAPLPRRKENDAKIINIYALHG